MDKSRIYILGMTLYSILTFITSCNSEEMAMNIPSNQEERTSYTASMKLNGGIQPFDEQEKTRAYTDIFTEGARLYLQFYNGTSRVDGLAIYNAEANSWTVNYYGSIAQNEESTCEVLYFENAVSYTHDHVTLAPETAVFIDTLATYLFKNNTITLTTKLKAQTGRIRWKGTSGQTVTYNGITCYTAYDIVNNTLDKSNVKVKQTVNSDGWTPYAYGSLTSDSQLLVYSTENENYGFCKTFETSVLANGKSGFINIPTTTSYNGWEYTSTRNLIFAANGVKFRMMFVENGTFTMGATIEQQDYADNDEYPVHIVTLTKDYHIGETEVTQELWQAVMGNNPSYNIGMQKPVEMVSWTDCQTFITKLNELTGHEFRLPTEAEWEFAARGGNQSNGYLYSGSNTIGDVAWYKDNSDGVSHDVKTKAPNELGIYDMSGNVYEWCQNCKYSYSSSPSTDPQGSDYGYDRVFRAGSFGSSANGCRVSDRYSDEETYTFKRLGLRIAK